jgi:Phage tail tube protein
MASAKAIAGTLFLAIDGVQFALQGNWKVQPNIIQRKPMEGQSGPLGFTQKFVSPYIKGDVSDFGEFSIQQLQNITNSTITALLVNGKTYVLNNGYWGDDTEVDTETGKAAVSLYGLSCTEILGS